jgi:GntR family transcriptional regulator/MocR family aminotransferase
MKQMTYELNVNLILDRGSRSSLREQILSQLKSAITHGVLPPGDPLPSSRVLAERLRVSRTTVLACYQELEGDGWI